jgi:putative ABC transport system ATP-binding protein
MRTVTQPAPTPIGTGPPLIELEGVTKVYKTGKLEYPALRGIDLRIDDGDMVAIVGPSGSGKSTIMNMITGIDRPTSGTVTVAASRIDQMSEEELAIWRGRHVGVVFQFFQLLPTLTALENAMLPLDFARRGSKRERRERALHNLELVGLADSADRLPSEMSGGQQQRVAIARALASYPTLVIGDEPTGNLDTVTAAEMFELLQPRLRRGRHRRLRHPRPRARRARDPHDHDPRRPRGGRVRRRSCHPPSCASPSRTSRAARRAHSSPS